MKVHRRVPYAPMHARTAPAPAIDGTVPAGTVTTGTGRTNSLGRAGRGVIIMAFALGSIGAEAGALSAHGDLASGHQPTGSVRLDAHASQVSPQILSQRPWMY
jgi:hypothetical protein